MRRFDLCNAINVFYGNNNILIQIFLFLLIFTCTSIIQFEAFSLNIRPISINSSSEVSNNIGIQLELHTCCDHLKLDAKFNLLSRDEQ